MPFSVFPDAANGPLSLGPSQISAPLDFAETAAGDPPAVYLRVVMLGAGCEPPDAPDPTFTLRADAGSPVELPEDRTVFVRDRLEEASAPVARAKVFIEGEHVYAIRILIDRPGSRWQLRITNNDDAERKFTWVVADNEPESAQPWLNLPQTLRFNAAVGHRVPQSVDVPNLGTGNLTVSLGGLATGSSFQLDRLPADIVPNHCGELIVTFNAPATAGTTEELYSAKSNDDHGTDSAQHNDRIRLIATTTASTPPPAAPPPVVDGIDPESGHPGDVFTILGADLVLHPGDDVVVMFFKPDQPTDPTAEPPHRCEVLQPTFPNQVTVRVPEDISSHHDHENYAVDLSRSDGASVVVTDDFFVALL
jgi:hypothetical protein